MVVLVHWTNVFHAEELLITNTAHLNDEAPAFFLPILMGHLQNILANTLIFDFYFATGGVLLFFLISGFVITLSLERYHPVEFIISRYFRLIPTLFFALVLITLLRMLLVKMGYIETIGFGLYEFFANAFLLTEPARVKLIELGVWTLLVEIKFYFIMALLFFVCRGNVKPYYFIRISLFFTCFVSLFMTMHPLNLFPQFYKVLDIEDHNILSAMKILTNTIPHIIYMFCGVISSYYYRNKISFTAYISYLIIMIAMYIICFYAMIDSLSTEYYLLDALKILFIFSVLTIVTKRQFLSKIDPSKKAIHYGFAKRSLSFLADISYPIYLIHGTFGMTLILYFHHLTKNQNTAFAISMILIVMICYFCHVKIELPMAKFGKRLSRTIVEKYSMQTET